MLLNHWTHNVRLILSLLINKVKLVYLMLSPYLIVRAKVITVNQETQLIVLYRKNKNRWVLRYITWMEIRNFIIGMIILSYIVRVFI